jgi:hypothetical protein
VKTQARPSEFQRFDAAIVKLLAMPRDVYRARLAEWKANPGSRERPKRKIKQPSAVSPASVDPPQA